ncbi:hypothetical protein D3C71_2007150 [compost metagenome]
MEAYLVCSSNQHGDVSEDKYFLTFPKAEKYFYQKIEKLSKTLTMPSADNLCGDSALVIERDDFFNKAVKLKATLKYWDGCHTDCGIEPSIGNYDIAVKQINIE